MQSCTAIVLAGGRATRLGGVNKAVLEVGGRRLLDRVLDALRPLADQIIVVGHLAVGLDLPQVEALPDPYPRASTLVALQTGLVAAQHPVALVVGCDMPFLSTPLLERLISLSEGHDLAVPRVGGYLEALHAAYRRSCLPTVDEAIRRRQLKIIDFYADVDTREVAESEIRELDSELISFFNVNTPADLAKARAIAEREEPGRRRESQ